MKIKEIDRTANIAWSPAVHHPIYIAAGTAAQQLDATFSTSAALEIYSLNLTEPGLDMGLVGTLNSEHRFHKVAWGCHGISEGDLPSGVLVGGADAGNLLVYDPAKLIKGEDALICQKDKHTGPVYALDFNTFQANLLASGSTDSEIFIWDLNSPNAPMTPGAKSQPHEDISCLAWNRQVQHILASTFPARCIVWDLRKNEPIIKVSDTTSRIHCKAVAWHPEVATQLCLASEDDHAPVVQLWDLRFATSPLKTLEHHQKGVLAIAWCPQDPDLLLSCGKDKRILCWNPNSNVAGGELVCEILTGDQWHFDVAWCPRNPAVISSASFDGHVGIYSLLGGQQQTQPSAKLAESFPGTDDFAQLPSFQQQQAAAQRSVSISLLKPPKWLRKPVGASFGFGGKLISFTKQQQPNAGAPAAQLVHISQVVTEQKLMAQSAQLESALSTGNFSDFCQLKVQACSDTNRQLAWSFLQANFDRSPRARMLSLLGYNPEDMSGQLSVLGGSMDDAESRADLSNDLGNLSLSATTNGEILDDSASAFDSIAAKSKEQEFVPFTITTDEGDADGLLNRALLTGNVEAAVNLCLQDGRWAEALILAQAGGLPLLQRTQCRYFRQAASDSAKVSSAVLNGHSSGVEVARTCVTFCTSQELRIARAVSAPDHVLCSPRYSTPDWLRWLVLFATVHLNGVEEQAHICARSAFQQRARVSPYVGRTNERVLYLFLKGRSNNIQLECFSLYTSLLALVGLEDTCTYCHWPRNSYVALREKRNIKTDTLLSLRSKKTVVNSQSGGTVRNFLVYSFRSSNLLSVSCKVSKDLTSSVPVQKSLFKREYYEYMLTSRFVRVCLYCECANYESPVLSIVRLPTTGPRSRYPSVHDPCVYNEERYGQQPQYYQSSSYTPSQSYMPSSQPQSQNFYGKDQGYGDQNSSFSLSSAATTPFPSAYGSTVPAGHTVSQMQPQAPPPAPPLSSSSNSGNAPPCWNDPPPVRPSTKQTAAAIPTFDLTAHIMTPQIGAPAPTMGEAPPPGFLGGYVPPLGQQFVPQQPSLPSGAMGGPPAPQVCPPVPVKEKGPIPPENQVLQDTFEDLRQNCVQAATNPQVRRKLDDVARKLEHLYDRLRENVLSAATTHGLHQIVQMIQQGDYAAALGIHSHLVSTSNFSETSSFMPGLKALLQVAQQLGVFLQ
ncbi:unnamed protein product [Ixodes persulcatus]